MTRWRAAIAVALVLLTSACATPPPKGTDGDLGNEWPAMAETARWVPQAGTCWDQADDTLLLAAFKPRECAKEEHNYEIIYVGDAGESPQPPVRASANYAKAWSECDAKVTEFFGGQWRERKIRIAIAHPGSDAWEAGARWYVCMLTRVLRINDNGNVRIAGTLKGKFIDPELEFGCHQVDSEGEYLDRKCTEPHNAEYVGIANWDASWESLVAETQKPGAGHDYELCRRLVSSYVGVPNIQTGTWFWLPTEKNWRAGDRTLRCHLYLGETSVSTSMKGVGAKGWPVK
ncbi:hypothetical protein Rhe02_56660 [Rhizocola hellebori]|uniref:Septum formation-related domain-containing protein n=1 Tax=Rhizocola hellebori TaxID=1392758 RepID=A0A8J3VHN8_9ACTN|nr:septum formation family protein [Rhizocola hellebori]GIH07599.1 hypothetical protein Rhe02_56660 [Rhizocola hellebori]